MITRRQLLASTGGLLLPRRLFAGSAAQRRFLFVYCYGGWDTTTAFTPASHIAGVDVEAEAVAAEAAGITFVDHPGRPSVRAFFESFGDRVCLINGMEVRSVAHFRCRDILLTGGGENRDDWASIIAGQATELAMPHLIIKGPAFNQRITGHVVRVGDDAQLLDLLSGEALRSADVPVSPLPPDAEALEDAFLRRRLSAEGDDLSTRYTAALDQLDKLAASQDALGLSEAKPGCGRSLKQDGQTAVESFSLGLSRCAMIQNDGLCDSSWDTHSNNAAQSDHMEGLFSGLAGVIEAIDQATDPDGVPLWETTTVVVISEMGRHPQLNAWGGKDHWTYTSAMLIGAGVAGGQVIGELSGAFEGQAVALDSGGLDTSGEVITPTHLGATLLAMANIDPGEWISAAPLTAVMS